MRCWSLWVGLWVGGWVGDSPAVAVSLGDGAAVLHELKGDVLPVFFRAVWGGWVGGWAGGWMR